MFSMGSKDSKGDFSQVPVAVGGERLLSKVEFQRLANVPPEAEWFANLTNGSDIAEVQEWLAGSLRRRALLSAIPPCARSIQQPVAIARLRELSAIKKCSSLQMLAFPSGREAQGVTKATLE
jgi:hypothetical protein